MSLVRRTLLPALAVAALLVGCASAAPADELPAASPEPAAPSASDESPAEPVESEESAEEDADPAACLHGTWLADNEFFLQQMREFGDEAQRVEGRVTMDFAGDGTVTTEYADWELTMLVDGIEGTLRREGVDSGTFEVLGDRVVIRETSMTSVLTATIAGMEMDFESDPVDYSDAALTCSVDEATITTSDGVVVLTRLDG